MKPRHPMEDMRLTSYTCTMDTCLTDDSIWYLLSLCGRLVRQRVITYPKSLSDIRNNIPKVISETLTSDRHLRHFRMSMKFSVNSCSHIRKSSFWYPNQFSDMAFGYPKGFSDMLWRFALNIFYSLGCMDFNWKSPMLLFQIQAIPCYKHHYFPAKTTLQKSAIKNKYCTFITWLETSGFCNKRMPQY